MAAGGRFLELVVDSAIFVAGPWKEEPIMRQISLISVFALLLPIIAACSSNNPCFDADKTSDPRDDVRVQLFMNGGPAGLEAAFGLEPAPGSGTSAQSRDCSPVSNDIAAPTNVVFRAMPGDVVTVELTEPGGNAASNSLRCRVTEDAFGPAEGTPGNVFIDAFPQGSTVQLLCSGGAETAP